MSKTPIVSAWAKKLTSLYAGATLFFAVIAGLLAYQITQDEPTDPAAIEITEARLLHTPQYQMYPPYRLRTADTVALPDRIDDWLKTPGGYYWYEFEFQYSADQPVESIYIPRFAMNAEVYLNGERVGYFGPMDSSNAERNWNRPQIVNLGPSQVRLGENTVSIQVFAFADYIAGLSTVWLGKDADLRRAYRVRHDVQVTSVYLSTAFVLGAGIVLTILLGLGKSRSLNLTLLAAVCYLWGIRNLAFLTTTPPFEHSIWIRITQGGLLVFAATLVLLILVYTQTPKRHWAWKIWWFYSLTFPVLIAIKAEWALRLVSYYGFAGLLVYAWGATALMRLGNARQQLAPHFFAFGMVCFVCLSVADLMFLIGITAFDGYFLNQYIGIVMFLAMSYFLIDRYSGLLHEADQFNDTLQARLMQRESELAAQYETLKIVDQEKVRLAERHRLMADMHDGMGAHLVAAIHQLQSPGFDKQSTLHLLESGLRDLQLAIDSLEPIDGDLVTLLGAFRYRIANSLKSSGIALHWAVDTDIPDLPYLDPRNCLHVLRIVQEVFTNILKHAAATEIHLSVSRGPKHVGVHIEDNGVGFDIGGNCTGKGMKTLRHRATQLGAHLVMDSRLGGGTRFALHLPIDNP
ncbi:MAG TPA: ATP-binding protein [Limnobacter sp.]|nr:ATP-binding protein [Limnobacter sp.]